MILPRSTDNPYPNPWYSFLAFLTTFSLLSYVPLCFQTQITLVILGLFVPWLVLSRKAALKREKSLLLQESFLPPAAWVALVLAAALFIRFWRLTSLSVWPMPDDGLYSYYALSLIREWRWKFFFSYTQVPPLTDWLLALFYKIIPPSLFSLRLFPALFSVLTVLVGWVGARKIFPPSTAFFLLFFCAFNFTFLYPAQFTFWAFLVLFFTVGALASLGLCADKSLTGTRSALLLGTVTGLGFFTGVSWPVVALSISIAAFCVYGRKRRKDLWVFLAFLSIGIILFAVTALREGYGSHMRAVAIPVASWALFMGEALKKLASLLWYSPDPATYGPLWGGMLDPVAGAFFLAGLAACWRRRREPFHAWLLLSLGLFLLPGLVASRFEIFRNVQVFAILALISALGFQELWRAWPLKNPAARGWALALLMAVSASLSFLHLNGPYHRLWGTPGPFWKNIKSVELYEAYNILKTIQKESGPGAVLADLRPDPSDVTLATAVYSFDAASNPGIPWKDVRWVAVLANANYKPFLESRFPSGRWHWLNKEGATYNQYWMLGIIPLDASNEMDLARWMEAERGFQPFTDELLESFKPSVRAGLEGKLLSLYPFMRGDPFLESCFWEKKIYLAKMDGNDGKVLEAVQQGLSRGYPLPQLFNDEGVLLERQGRYEEARKAFKKALRAPVNITPAKENLEPLEQKFSGETK